MRTRSKLLTCALALGLAAGPLAQRAARADSVASLTDTLSSSSSEKERISAVTALARLGDKRALRPLVSALHDPSAMVRAIAAAGLGKLGHRASLPALRDAVGDADALVAKRAREAITRVCQANNLPDETAAPAATTADPAPPTTGKPGFGRSPRALAAHPDVYVVLKTTKDDSPGTGAGKDAKTRKENAAIIRDSLNGSLRTQVSVTNVAEDAKRYGLDPCQVDLSIVKLEQRQSGDYIEIQADLRLAISDNEGRMKSFLTNGAKVQVPRRTFDPRYLPQLRREALENAVKGIVDDLLVHLRRTAHS
ncbi:MAG: HEAT repeat domain-containing protein [Deltaproteobacteria bacterium]|nr:HEAT repeat domain-containing protein [Deltaproteobacteria bacterium]